VIVGSTMSSEAEQKTTDSEQLALENEPKEDVGPGIIDKEVESSEASKQVEPSNITGTNKKEDEKEPENHLATPTLAETEPVNEKEPEKEKEPGKHVATPTLSEIMEKEPTTEETTVNANTKDGVEVLQQNEEEIDLAIKRTKEGEEITPLLNGTGSVIIKNEAKVDQEPPESRLISPEEETADPPTKETGSLSNAT
jgi:hypothetical protein